MFGKEIMFFKNVSLRKKVIIFIVLSVIGIAIVAKAGWDNYQTKKANEEKQIALQKQEEKKAKEAQEKAAAEEAKKEEKRKELESRYDEAYKAFHNSEYEKAIKLCDDIIKEDDSFYSAHSVKGIAICYKYRNQFKEGMAEIDRALELKPDFAYGRFNKALAYELFGHYEDALTWYDKALELEDYVWSYYGKASIYGRKGDVENTVKFLKKAIELDASVKSVAAKENDFANVREALEFKELLK